MLLAFNAHTEVKMLFRLRLRPGILCFCALKLAGVEKLSVTGDPFSVDFLSNSWF